MIGQSNASFAFSLRKKPRYQLNGRLWDLQKQDSNTGSYRLLPSRCTDYAIPTEATAVPTTTTTKTKTTTTTTTTSKVH